MEAIQLSPCWYCGNLTSCEKPTKSRLYCQGCQERYEADRELLISEYVERKIKVMWQRAINMMEKQTLNINDYYDESQYVLDLALHDSNKFASSAEMITAMELLRNRIKTKVEYKILRYRVDFLLPDLKVVLEIDGRLHDFKVTKDNIRDANILNYLNDGDSGWEIIRIPTKHIESNVKQLLPAIHSLYQHKQELRRTHYGFIPANHSRRSAMDQIQVTKGIKDERTSFERDRISNRVDELDPGEL